MTEQEIAELRKKVRDGLDSMNKQTELPGTDLRAFANEYNQGLTKREYACIHLKVPESGTEWLDELITKSLRDDFSKHALGGYCEKGETLTVNDRTNGRIIEDASFDYAAYAVADAMLQERNKP